MLHAEWTNEGAHVFAMACGGLNLHGASIADVERIAKSMTMLTFYDDKKPIGASVLVNGGIHIAVSDDYRKKWLNKRILLAFRNMLKLADNAMISKNNNVAHGFARSFGWKPVRTEGDYVVYQP